MSYKISDIEGIGPKLIIKLEKAGITSIDSLLKACSTRSGRVEVSLRTGISEDKLLKWVNMADLYRVNGIGIEYTELLEAAGIEAIGTLKGADPERLYEKMVKVNSSKKFVLQVPTLEEVANFVNGAKKISSAVLS